MPKWMSALDTLTPPKAGGLAVLLSALNPRNLILVIGGGTVVAQADLSVGDQVIAWAVSQSGSPSRWGSTCSSAIVP
jgi:hypothetical protein